MGILGPDESIEVLRGLLGKEYKFGQAAIDAVAKARKDLAVGLLAEAARKNEYAGWALIRMGAAGEAGVLALLEESPGSVGMAQYHLVRQYFDHWDELSAPAPTGPGICLWLRPRPIADNRGLGPRGGHKPEVSGRSGGRGPVSCSMILPILAPISASSCRDDCWRCRSRGRMAGPIWVNWAWASSRTW